ncbi:acyltransferase family protein [Streptomyces chrestomyceticus]|uniref:acyltransferase family protein n=1 Tax=Streptomyces chrestomyceticus TaxID=68185 RepID=UPI0019D09CBF|nr:acyltransferase [Streptomyces chrestomyceticus]
MSLDERSRPHTPLHIPPPGTVGRLPVVQRDRAVDGLRALALLAVPTGHWLVGGFVRDPDSSLHNASPLSTFAPLAPITWVLQMLGIFFLVGGYASVLSFRRATGRGTTPGDWLRGRLARLLRPAVGVTAVWAVLAAVLYAAGVPLTTLHTAATLVVQPLWFVGVYAVVTALTPYCMAASRRLGGWAAAPLAAVVAVVDFLRYGPYADSVPYWATLISLIPGWLFGYQLGVSWGEKRLGRRGARLLLAGGVVLFTALLLVFHYPASLVGVPGQDRTNSHPPSLLVIALAAAQSGAAILLRDRIAALLRRPALWAPVTAVNRSAMTILCWHQTAMLAVAVPAAFAGTTVEGLTTAPDFAAWMATRLPWLPLFAVVLVLVARVARRLELPWTGISRGQRVCAAVLAVGFAAFALRLTVV